MQFQDTPLYQSAAPFLRRMAALAADLPQKGTDDGDLYAVARDLLPAISERLTGEDTDAATELVGSIVWPTITSDASTVETALQIGAVYLLSERRPSGGGARSPRQLAAARFLKAAALAALAVMVEESPDLAGPAWGEGHTDDDGIADLVATLRRPCVVKAGPGFLPVDGGRAA